MRDKLAEHGAFLAAFVGVLVVGTVARVLWIGAESLRLDEAQSIWQASHSMEFIRTYMLKNVHLPLHNTLLHVWMQLFGTSEAAVRMLAVIPGVLLMPVTYALAREFVHRNWAVFCMGLVAISPFFVWYSREIRMYSLLALVATLSHLCFIRALREDKVGWYLAYAAVGLVGIYTHYFFLLVLFVHLVFFLATWKVVWGSERTHKVRQLVAFGLVAGGLLIAFAPWLYGLVTTYGSGSLAPIFGRPTSFNMALSLFEFIFGYQPQWITGLLFALWPLLTLFGFFFLAKRSRIPPLVWLLLLGILLPILIAFVVSVTWKPLFLTRYLTVSAAPLYVLIAWFASELPRWQRTAAVSIGALLVVMLGIQQFSPANPAKEDYLDAVIYLEAETTSRDIVVLAPPYLIYPFQYYYNGPARITSMPIWDKREGAIPLVTPEQLARDAESIKGSHKRIFLLVGSDLLGAPEVRAYFDNHLTKLDKRQFSQNLFVHVYQAEYPDAQTATTTSERVHTVVYGDTFSDILWRYYGNFASFSAVVRANNIQDIDIIHVGQVLILPSSTPL